MNNMENKNIISDETPVPDDTQRQKMDWTEDKDLMA
jgi:hypothetical protein